MNYREAWTFLDNLQFFKIKLGLDSMNIFLDELGRPQEKLRFVHVAGTNGKGSVGMTLLSLLAAAGFRVGFYTSPHLSSVRERFRINDVFISEEEFAVEATRIHDILAGRQITYFEFTTALALLWFARQQVDLAVMEVGLGGRLDATNVIRPLVSVISNISMDHEQYLGSTLPEIAAEKAGIIKPDVPLVFGEDQLETGLSEEVLRVIRDSCRDKGAPLYQFVADFYAEPERDGSWTYWSIGRCGSCQVRKKMKHLPCSLKGKYQYVNSAVALAALDLLHDHGFHVNETELRSGLSRVKWPGRLEHFRVSRQDLSQTDRGREGAAQFLLDGAHNPAGVDSLARALAGDFTYRSLILVWGVMSDKNIALMLSTISPLAARIIFTRPHGERSAEPESLISRLPEEMRARAEAVPSVIGAIDRAMGLAAVDDLICVAGSLYLVGEAREYLLGGIV